MVTDAGRGLQGNRRLLIFACDGSSGVSALNNTETAVVNLTCMAQLPPSFIDFILSRDLADGVALAGCSGGDCQYRMGARWTEQRMKRQRDPRLRKRVDSGNLALLWAEPWCEFSNTKAAVASFRDTLASTDKPPAQIRSRNRLLRPIGITLAWGLFAVSAGLFTMWPPFSQLEPDKAIISLTFSHAGERLEECRKLSQEELNKLPPNMRKPMDCPRERYPVRVSFRVDNEVLYSQSLQPSGFWKDGESTVYNRIELPAGSHELFIGMSDSGRTEGFDFNGRTRVSLAEGQHLVIEFDHRQKSFIFR
jgi:coenzyme F420-reducing hydrogenase delta subunit